MANDFEKGLKIASFDIESTALDAQYGYILCACIKEVLPHSMNGKITSLRIDDYKDKFSDMGLVKDINNTLNSYDLIVGWYSSRFDFPMVQTRSLFHGLFPPVKNYRRDLCLCARGFGKLKNNQLANWSRYLLGKEGKKNHIDWKYWLGAMRGESKCLDKIVEHCEYDVTDTERIYKKVMPLLGKLKKGG